MIEEFIKKYSDLLYKDFVDKVYNSNIFMCRSRAEAKDVSEGLVERFKDLIL